MLKELSKGFFRENPLFVQVLGVCPALATTTSLENALGMGIAFTLVLVCSNLLISLLHRFIPDDIRIPSFIVIIASLVTVTEMLMHAYTPLLYEALGLYIALIVVNCVILGRAEAFASKNGAAASVLDGLGMGAGFTLALAVIASVRELLGNGTLLGFRLLPQVVPPALIFILPAGAFITMGFLFAAVNCYRRRKEAVNRG